jgi:enamine deaminase RidA (YjgF/YER057c/UK114 family)
MSFEARIKELGLIIPEPPRPAGHFVPTVQVGNLAFVSGQIPAVSGWLGIKGKLGRDLSIEQGQEAELPLGALVELELIVEVQS